MSAKGNRRNLVPVSLALVFLAAATLAVAACGGEDVDALRDLEEGKLAPPGVTLVKHYGDDGPYPNDASYQRVYQAPATTNEGIFMKLFESELEEKRGWRPSRSGTGWFKGEFGITAGGGGELNH